WASLAVSAPERENQRPPRNDTNRFRTATCSGQHVLTTSLPGLFNPEERNAAPTLTGLWAWIFDWSPNAGRSRKNKKTRRSGFFLWPMRLPVVRRPVWPIFLDAEHILCCGEGYSAQSARLRTGGLSERRSEERRVGKECRSR